MSLWLVFLTGLTTGGLSCFAMQGGLLASVMANQKEAGSVRKNKKRGLFSQVNLLPVSFFLLAKLVAHLILGFLLGVVGSAISLSLGIKVGFQIFTALFMIFTALNLLEVHPIFRYVALQPPRFLRRYLGLLSKRDGLFAAVVLGLMTVFIPCGVTQAMEVLAINSADGVRGALTLGVFVLGTSPLFVLIGLAVAGLSTVWNRRFLRVTAVGLLGMALFTLHGVLMVLDVPLRLPSFVPQSEIGLTAACNDREKEAGQCDFGDVQPITIEVVRDGYSPNYFRVKKGVPVELTIETKGIISCASAFVLRDFNISTQLGPTDKKTFTFTPTQVGQHVFSCSMGMYSGILEVIP